MIRLSDSHRELVEGCLYAVAGGDIGGDFVVATAQVLDQRIASGQNAGGPVVFESAHRPEPGFQPSVIGFDQVARVPGGVQRGWDEIIQDPRISRGGTNGFYRAISATAGT
jgi:hypothetical protein